MSKEPKKMGRPKGAVNLERKMIAERVREMAIPHAEAALLALAEMMMDEEQSGSVRVSAANAILDRAAGKPLQAQEVEHKGNVSLTTILEQIRAKGVSLNDID